MHELQAIVDAYADARQRSERAALATVVNVIGSAYRRPGAKMLITETGSTCGSISGGCLERDVAERAMQVISSGESSVIEYDTRGDEDIVWGMGLGCNGVVKVLLESTHEGSSATRALQFISDCLHGRQNGVIATVIKTPPAATIYDAKTTLAKKTSGYCLMLKCPAGDHCFSPHVPARTRKPRP